MKKIVVTVCTLALAGCMLTACSSNAESDSTSETTEATETVEVTTGTTMQYLTTDELYDSLEDESYLVVDVRKAADYETSHITGAVGIDMDAAKNGDYDAGVAAMTEGLEEATGSETADGKTIVLVCYTGKSYAQAATDVLNAMGADMDNVYTLEGGFEAWTNGFPDAVE